VWGRKSRSRREACGAEKGRKRHLPRAGVAAELGEANLGGIFYAPPPTDKPVITWRKHAPPGRRRCQVPLTSPAPRPRFDPIQLYIQV